MSSGNDNAGRIHKQAFIVSTALLYAFGLLTTAARFYIRRRLRKNYWIDDGFLIFAICCLTISLSIMYSLTINKMYLVEALTMDLPGVELPADLLQEMSAFHKWISTVDVLCWGAIMAVKFSFLVLFRRLIQGIKSLIVYWWIVTLFNIGTLGYGASVYFVLCPNFSEAGSLRCTSVTATREVIVYPVVQMALDLAGDFLVLYIPVRLLWKVQIKWTQKLALTLSLCLTVVLVVLTITRVSGLKFKGNFDTIWETYWLILSAEVGIVLTSVAAFRAFFVSRSNRNRDRGIQPLGTRMHWCHQENRYLKQIFSFSFSRSNSRVQEISRGYPTNEDAHLPMSNIPGIPRAHIVESRALSQCVPSTRN